MDREGIRKILSKPSRMEILVNQIIGQNPQLYNENNVFYEALKNMDIHEAMVILHRKDVILPEDMTFTEFSVKKADRGVLVPDHKHDYMEMVYVYEGSLSHTIDGQKITVKQGEIFLMDTQIKHSVDKLEETDLVFNIMLTKDFWENILQNFLRDNDIFYRFVVDALYHKKDARFLHFHCSNNMEIQDHMFHLLSENYERKAGSHSMIVAEFLIIFNYLLRDSELIRNYSAESHRVSWLDSLNDYIKNNLLEANLPAAASHLNFNPNYLSSLLKQSTGKNFTEFVQEIKLKQACFILANTDYPISKIAEEVGYSNVSYFYKIFYQKFGQTPKEYRNDMTKV